MLFSLFKKKIKPFNSGWLSVGEGHKIHYMEVGNPCGQVVLKFHGGPGGCCRIGHAEAFNLKKYRIVLFDQRGGGKSTFEDIVLNNTPQTTLEDAEKLLKHLNIPMNDIIVSGGSYGSTLALLFAEKHPKAIKSLILNAIFLAREKDLNWSDKESGIFYPDLMDEMKSVLKPKEELVSGFHRLMFSGNYEQMKTAMQYYGAYERLLGSLKPSFKPVTALFDDRVNSFKVFLHYEKNKMFLKEDEILKNIHKIKHIPTLIVHNRLDITCPIYQAYDLVKQLENCMFKIVPDIGHWSPKLKKTMIKEISCFLEKYDN